MIFNNLFNFNQHYKYRSLEDEAQKSFNTFSLGNEQTTKKLKGGEIGFIVSQSDLKRKIISFVQNTFSKAPNNRKAAHAFVVIGKEDDKIIRIAEAADRGLKEERINLEDLKA